MTVHDKECVTMFHTSLDMPIGIGFTNFNDFTSDLLTNEFVNQFKHVFIIDENMSYFKENINRKQSKNRKFLDAVYFLTINNLYYVDCNETVNFIVWKLLFYFFEKIE